MNINNIFFISFLFLNFFSNDNEYFYTLICDVEEKKVIIDNYKKIYNKYNILTLDKMITFNENLKNEIINIEKDIDEIKKVIISEHISKIFNFSDPYIYKENLIFEDEFTKKAIKSLESLFKEYFKKKKFFFSKNFKNFYEFKKNIRNEIFNLDKIKEVNRFLFFVNFNGYSDFIQVKFIIKLINFNKENEEIIEFYSINSEVFNIDIRNKIIK